MVDTKLSNLPQGTIPPNYWYGEAAGTSQKFTGLGVINVMDYGAKGDGSTDDTAAIRSAIAAMLNFTSIGGKNVKGTTLYFPPGIYSVSQVGGDAIDAATFEIGGNNPSCGRIVGAGQGATIIQGFNAYNMIFNMPENGNTVSEISGMTISNSSTVIGTGAVRMNGFNPITLVQDLSLTGMTCLELGFFAGTAISITTIGSSGVFGATYPNYGSIGIHLGGGSVIGWNTSSGGHEIGLMAGGNTGGSILACRCEEAVNGMLLGIRLGTATLCTIGNIAGTDTLTITSSSHQYPDPHVTGNGTSPFLAGAQIVGNGIPPTAFVSIAAQLTNTEPGGENGGRGTYSLNGASGITVSSAVPMTARADFGLYSCLISGFETEGCGVAINVQDIIGCTITDCDLTTNGLAEGATFYGSKTGTPLCGLALFRVQSSNIINVRATGGVQQAAIMFQPNNFNPSFQGSVLDNCIGGFSQTVTTSTAAFIDSGTAFPNPSGVAGTVLSLPAGCLSGNPQGNATTIGIGALISGAGIPTGANTPSLDHGFSGSVPYTSFGTPLPSNQICTAAVGSTGGGGQAPQQYGLVCPGGNLNITGVVITLQHGQAYGQQTIPTNTRTAISNIVGTQKSGLFFRNCDYANDSALAMKFADLPNAFFGGSNSQPRIDGIEYEITDCGTPVPGAVAFGGGIFLARVKWSAANTNWFVTWSPGNNSSYTVATLPTGSMTGMRTLVTNGVANPVLGALVGVTTGASIDPVYFDGTAWRYG
jgi:Pectate lyase superfamily protein